MFSLGLFVAPFAIHLCMSEKKKKKVFLFSGVFDEFVVLTTLLQVEKLTHFLVVVFSL